MGFWYLLHNAYLRLSILGASAYVSMEGSAEPVHPHSLVRTLRKSGRHNALSSTRKMQVDESHQPLKDVNACINFVFGKPLNEYLCKH